MIGSSFISGHKAYHFMLGFYCYWCEVWYYLDEFDIVSKFFFLFQIVMGHFFVCVWLILFFIFLTFHVNDDVFLRGIFMVTHTGGPQSLLYFIAISFSTSGRFSAIILVNIFLCLKFLIPAPSSTPFNIKFHFFRMSEIPWMLWWCMIVFLFTLFSTWYFFKIFFHFKYCLFYFSQLTSDAFFLIIIWCLTIPNICLFHF